MDPARARETSRHHCFVSPITLGLTCGLGSDGYRAALHHFGHFVKE
ncbi:type II 3-dehydroquinate dehydratase [Pseudomonas sp. G34]